jgi:hydroxymethylpyrimidine/phosphomethylpyrimidine kinase
MNRRPCVLVIAGSDSSGGAGLIRDVQVLSDLGVDSLCAITAVTAQSDSHVRAVHLMPAELVCAQISVALSTRPVDAIKIGMLGNRAIVEAVAQCLPARTTIPIVLDPVMVSSSGTALLDAEGRQAMRLELFPRVSLITPNLPEAATLLDEMIADDERDQRRQACRLREFGAEAVLIKGGHGAGAEAVDLLVTGTDPVRRLASARLDATCRGTGCALGSAIAAGLAFRLSLEMACVRGKHHVHGMLRRSGVSAPSSPVGSSSTYP